MYCMYVFNIICSPETVIDCILDELKHNDTTFPELKKNWRAIVRYRLNDIKSAASTADILKNWKHYSIPYGHERVIN